MKKLSIIVPVYNEKKTIEELLKMVKKAKIDGVEKEIIVIDDGSSDSTSSVLTKQTEIKIIYQSKNQGKGAAIKIGLQNCSGDIVIVQDADLEYDPNDINLCVKPILDGLAKVVYGSRELQKRNKKHSSYLFFCGGKIVTLMTNLLYGSHLTDEPTCYKCFKTDLIKSIKIDNNDFAWEPEITAKILKQGIKIKEVPVKYFPRHQGKKITYLDGFKALWTLLKYRFHD